MNIFYPFAAFLGAFLLFLVQPLMAKQILPWFGGAATVWTTCLVFFQIALVAGYAYAHFTKRLGLKWQVGLHGILLLGAAAMLPIEATREWQPSPSDPPVASLLTLLLGLVGPPYILVAATAPLLQDWYAQSSAGRSPYRLYVYSNIGSLVGLLLYPLVIERLSVTSTQALAWAAGYGVFLVVCLICGFKALAAPRREVPPAPIGTETARSARLDQWLWFLLAACGSGLLLAITNRMCQDVAAIPLLWVVPLSLYLGTFILCFAGFYRRRAWGISLAISLAFAAFAAVQGPAVGLPGQILSLGFLLFATCMVCHGEMVRLKPGAESLTGFYLIVAIGGAAGGMFVALLAPVLFTTYAELPLLLACSVAIAVGIVARERARSLSGRVPALLVATPIAALSVAVVVVVSANQPLERTVAVRRSFYGILRVIDDPPGTPVPLRRLYHGQVLHGAQRLDLPAERPGLYYGPGSGVDFALRSHAKRLDGESMSIAVIGLGAGTLARLGATGDRMTFFELDPHVLTFAQECFTFLRDSRADVEIVLGDARLSLERGMTTTRPTGGYDLMILDAFSGDSVPVHLLTREAFDLYRQALASDGVLVVHVSNLYLDIGRVVADQAAAAGLEATMIRQDGDKSAGTITNEWMLLAADPAFVARARTIGTPAFGGGSAVWTDGYSSLISVLRQ